jgi:Domain of unknown function DUF29
MHREIQTPLSQLYLEDETAWLEEMARLVAERRFEDLDVEHLSEVLADMARRDRREVLSRLTTLLAHLLKWEHQPGQCSHSWRATITTQRNELHDLLESGTLRNYAGEVLGKAYQRAVTQASLETDFPAESFPPECPFSLAAALGDG